MKQFPKFLRITSVQQASFVITLNKTANGEYEIIGGPEGEVIKICAQALNFSYKIIPAPAGAWGNFKDGKWDGGIGLVYRNEADIGIGKFGVSDLRRQYIDYSFPYSLEDLTFAIKKPGLRSPIDALTHPFSYSLWIAVLIAMIIMVIIFSLFLKESLTTSALHVFGLLTSQTMKIKNNSWSKKMVESAWACAAMILSYCYVAVLLSFLTVPLMEKEPETIDEFAEAISAGTHQAMVLKGAMQLQDLQQSKRAATQIIAKHIVERDNFVQPERDAIVGAMRKGKKALILPSDTLRFFVQEEFFVSKDSFKSHPSAVIMSKSFCCKKQIDSFVHVLSASGIYPKLVRDVNFITGLKSKSFEIDDATASVSRSLSVIDMSGAFILIIMGHALSVITILAEIIHFKCFAKRKKRKSSFRKIRAFRK